MTDLKILLKRLILANFVLLLAVVLLDVIFFESLPTELQAYQNRMAEDEHESFIVLAVGLPLLLMYFLSLVLLWKLKRIGRTMFAAVWIFSLILTAGMTPQIFHQVTAVANSISILLNGLMFGLIYYSDLRFYFEKNPAEEI